MNLRTLALSLPLLWVCAAAQAQTVVPHAQVRAGTQAPASAQTGSHVARSQSELDQLGFPGISGVDFQQEMVLAIVMTPQTSLGMPVRVGVHQVTRQGQDLEVTYRVSRSFGFAVPVRMRPFVLIRTARVSGAVGFTRSPIALPAPGLPTSGLIPPGQLPFHVVGHGSTSADLPSGQHLFRSASELRQSGFEGLVPDSSAIRWSQEVVAVILAGQPGYRVRSTRLRGSLTAPSGGRLTLDYELSLAPPDLVPLLPGRALPERRRRPLRRAPPRRRRQGQGLGDPPVRDLGREPGGQRRPALLAPPPERRPRACRPRGRERDPRR